MVLAVTTLLFHISTIPKTLSLPAAATAGTAIAATAAKSTSAVELSTGSKPAAAPGAEASHSAMELEYTDPALTAEEPEVSLTYEPGRLVPERAASPEPAAAPAAFRSIETDRPAAAGNEGAAHRFWIGLSLAQHGAAAFDAWSTRRVIVSGAGTELNPLLRPFAGNASMYAAVQVGPVILDYVSYRMMHSEHAWAQRSWWVPQAVATALSVASGVHNMGVYAAAH